jgi:hypothetical protein
MASLIDRITLGELEIAIVDIAPNGGSGYTALTGVLVIANSTGELFRKFGVADTDWAKISDSQTPIDPEQVQDALSSALTNSTTVNFTYNDPANTISATVNALSLTNAEISASAAISLNKLAILTANRALISDASGIISVSTVTNVELNFLSGVTSSVQTQLNNKQPLDSTLTALSVYNTNGIVTQTAADTFTGRTITGSASLQVANGDGVAGNPTLTVLPAGVDHNSLSNLATGDVHSQYTLSVGRSGGQTINGGTAASENLNLSSTSNVTKGLVIIGSNAIDQANNRLGIGTAAPQTTVDILSGTVREQKSMSAITTTNATATTLFTIPIANNSVELLKIKFTALNTTTFNSASYERTVRVKNISNTVTTGTFQADYTNEDGPMSPCNVQVVVSGTNILIQAIGIAATNINWKAILDRMV